MAQEQAHCASDIVSNSHSFIPSQSTFPFLKYGYQRFNLENPRSWSWVKSKFKVTTWVPHPINSHPFGSMSIHPLVAMIELFWNLTFKIQGQSHSWRSHSWYNILSTHIPFIPCWSALLFLRFSYLKNWPWKSKVKIMARRAGASTEHTSTILGKTSTRVVLAPALKFHGRGQSFKSQCESNILSTHIP